MGANRAEVVLPTREEALLVFGQCTNARVDVEAWNAHAVRFFSTRIGLTIEKRYELGIPPPSSDDFEFVVAPEDETSGIRSVFARPCEANDVDLADAADARAGCTGLALVARRCGMVWLVERREPSDRLSFRLAAILASVLLGPILDGRAGELFGVKTARAKLERMSPQTTRS